MIYLVEDDNSIRELVAYTFNTAGLEAEGFDRPSLFWEALEKRKPDLVLLDIMLPGADGFEVYQTVEHVPTIFLTAKGGLSDRVKGLRMGAEDYITKPFELMELLARVETVLRRCGKSGRVISLMPDIEIDTASRVVRKNGAPVALTVKEYDLLLFFARNPGTALYRETIYEHVWGGEYSYGSKTVDLHIQRLRKKVGWENRLLAVNKVGYRLEV